MPDKVLHFNRLTGGLMLGVEETEMPAGTTRRNRGIHPIIESYFRTRDGSTQLHALNAAHSLYYFNDTWYSGVSTSFYSGTGSIKTGLSGDRLSFVSMPPTAGKADWLFVAGGEDLFKVASDDTVAGWGIEAPSSNVTVADAAVAGNPDGTYIYRVTYRNSTTGHRSNAAPVDAYTILLLHCDGADASTTFTDSSSIVHTVTAVGNAQLDTAQKKFGTASGLFDGNGDYLTVPDDDGGEDYWYFGYKPFTIDFRVRFSSLATDSAFFYQHDDSSNYWYLKWEKTGTALQFLGVNGSGAVGLISTLWSPVIDTWYHVALIRGWGDNPNLFAVCVDGTVLDTDDSSLRATTEMPDLADTLRIGHVGLPSTQYMNGWLDEVRVSKGIARWTTDFTPEATAYTNSAIATVTVTTNKITVSNIPESGDSQVDQVELWRTAASGTAYFLLARLASGATSYTDNIADSALSSTELPTDNYVPYSWLDDCFGPYNASCFWLTRSQEGERGRVYYSAIGRTEAMQGYIEVCSDDKGLQKGVMWNDTPFVFGEAGVYQIAGTNPYFTRQAAGVPGTTKPHTVSVTPAGIVYEAEDGVRVFNGSSSALLSATDVQLLFRGQSAGALSSFDGVVACYGRGTYFISDEDQLIGFDVSKRRWRDVGDLSVTSLFYTKDADIIGVATNADGIYNLENEGDEDDNSNNIEIDLETNHVRLGEDEGGLVKYIHIDHESNDASGETLTVYLEHDGEETELGTVSQYTRGVDTLHVNRMCRSLGVRITGSVDDWVKIYRVSAQVYLRGEEMV